MQEHEYVVLGGINRAQVGRYLSIFAALISAGVVYILLSAVDLAAKYGLSVTLTPSIMSLAGAATVFGILYWMLNRWVWRWPLVTGFLKVPNLAGDWICKGESVQTESTPARTWQAKITIVQSWDRIRVRLKTDQSGSNSTSAALICDPADGFRLFYSYKNDPNINETDLRSHRGFAEITFAKDLKSGEGEYFNGHGRYTFGTMRLERA